MKISDVQNMINGPWRWISNQRCKYVRFSVDMRDGSIFAIDDRDGNRISPDEFRRQGIALEDTKEENIK